MYRLAARHRRPATRECVVRRCLGMTVPATRGSLLRGWLAVGLSALLAGFWAYWGAIENFHEGWYASSLARNVALAIAQYLSPMLLVAGVGIAAVYWPRLGAALHVAAGIGALWFFRASGAGSALIAVPLVSLGLLYATGTASPRRWAVVMLTALPISIAITFGAGPARRVFARVDDRVRDARVVDGWGIRLLWAPSGPGWPANGGLGWVAAADRCARLDASGKVAGSGPERLWRLPTVEEAVASMALHGVNARGRWDPDQRRATYERRPDKESPLWDTRSPVIYWWTGTAVDAHSAYMIAYDGNVFARSTGPKPLYFGFRCVRVPGMESPEGSTR